MLKVEDIQAVTDYCRVQGQSGRAAARVFRVLPVRVGSGI